MAMVKADAYGHGMVMAAKAFGRAGCTTFGVAELREAVLLREAGIQGDIYVTIGFAEDDAGLILAISADSGHLQLCCSTGPVDTGCCLGTGNRRPY